MCLTVIFASFWYPRINVYVNKRCNDSKNARARETFRVIWLCMSRLVWFLMTIWPFFQVKFDVSVRYNMICAYCVPTLCEPSTPTPPRILRTQNDGCQPLTIVCTPKRIDTQNNISIDIFNKSLTFIKTKFNTVSNIQTMYDMVLN